MKKPLLSLFALTLLFSQSCKIDAPEIETNGTGPSAQSDSYLPLTTGTFWKYNNVLSGMAPDTVTIKVTGETTTVNGRLYHNITSTSKAHGSTAGLYYYGNHIAVLRANTVVAGLTLDFQFLNDTTAVGHTWTSRPTDNGLINGVPGRLTGKVIEKGVSKIIGGHTFTDVINTQIDLEYDLLGTGFQSYGTYHFFVAKGIGLIEIDSEAFGAEIGKERIIDYSIK
jgi:hypothetical protein